MTSRFHTLHRHVRRRSVRVASIGLIAVALLLPTAATAGAATICDRTFTGDATGSRDVTSSLTAFLDNHGRKRLCLKPNGRYRVNGIVRITNEYGLRLDGRNATLRPSANSSSANRRQLNIESTRNTIIKNLNIRGLNPDYRRWNASRQHEPGIWINGGDNIRLTNVSVTDTYGDGIYIGYKDGALRQPSRITLEAVRVQRVGRNGIAIVGGNNILITRAAIVQTGLHSVDLEPDRSDANIHHVTVTRSWLRMFGLSNSYDGYAFAANGKAGRISYITVTGNSADRFSATVQNKHGGTHRNIVFTGNRSSLSATAYFSNIDGLKFYGNVRITARKSNVH